MAGIRTENKIYEVGIYCRLSKDDGTDNESASIATQKSILTDYVKRQGWHLAKTYVDDGYSGTNFQRPSFQNMIKDIENGLINCVITKDLSRLGRNYLDCGLYLEVFFPEHNVRYIAVNDGVDTLNKSAMDITPFRNILNEMYSADVSVKIKSAYRARFQQGKFMGTTAPYGYVKDPADHNHLLIDDKVAHVVREIFDLALAGNGIAKIRKHINKQHILRPAAYAVEQGATGYERYFEDNEENRYIWSENSVRGILRSPIYAGNLAGYKRIAANMKSKKRPSKLPEEWEVIPDTHEGIVTQEEFDTVQQLMTSRRREQNAGGFENIFSGVIKCADCGYAMRAASANRRKRPDIIDCVQYTCNNYGRYGNVMCTAHSIEARDLFNAVLADINRFADMAVNDEKAVRAIERRLTETDQSRAKSLEKEKKKLNKRLAELDRLFSSLYEDKVMERITERNFEMMSGKYQKEQLEIEARLKEVTETLNDSYEKSQGVRDFLSLIRNYQGLKELDATIINALIDKILVSEREKLADGTVRQEIKIYYKFIGFVGELHITPTKRWTALKPKNCTVCGVEYVPSSGISKYCPACAKRIQREKSNESKRRSRERNRRACIELSAKNDRLGRRAGQLVPELRRPHRGVHPRLLRERGSPSGPPPRQLPSLRGMLRRAGRGGHRNSPRKDDPLRRHHGQHRSSLAQLRSHPRCGNPRVPRCPVVRHRLEPLVPRAHARAGLHALRGGYASLLRRRRPAAASHRRHLLARSGQTRGIPRMGQRFSRREPFNVRPHRFRLRRVAEAHRFLASAVRLEATHDQAPPCPSRPENAHKDISVKASREEAAPSLLFPCRLGS